MAKKILAWVMTLSMLLSLLPAVGVTALAESKDNDDEYIFIDKEGVPHSCWPVTDDMSILNDLGENDGWYVIEDIDSDIPLVINGEITLILKGTSTKPGILLTSGDSLTILEDPVESGALIVTQINPNLPGIGGTGFEPCGDLTIVSGTVTATGGTNGAGIGGGHGMGGGNVTIKGGVLTAIGGHGAAGIGCGKGGVYPGTVTVNDNIDVMAGFSIKDMSLIPHESDENLQKNLMFFGRQCVVVGTGEPGHVHKWEFTLKGEDTIQATCIGEPEPCDYKGKDTSLTIKAPAGKLVYDGKEKTAALSGKTLVGIKVDANDIKYYKGGNEVRPINPGVYVAEYTFGGVTASVTFTIQETPKPTHTHDWTYSADGATITATCKGVPTPCDYKTRDTKLTIQAPANLVYDGKGKTATLSGKSLAGNVVDPETILYYAKGDETNPINKPVNAGSYVATFTYGGATARVEFSITKAKQTIAAPTVKTKTASTVELNPVGAGYGETTYGWSRNKGTEPTNWQKETAFAGLTEKTDYYFFAKYAGDENHDGVVSVGTKVTTGAAKHAHDWTYTANGATITAKCEGEPLPCDYKGKDKSLTIQAPAGELVYDGKEKTATLSAKTLTSVSVKEADIQYYFEGSVFPMLGHPTDAGSYEAQYTFGGATAKVSFSIAKAKQAVPTPKLYSKVGTTVTLDEVRVKDRYVQYAYNTSNAAPEDGWQDSTCFTDLAGSTDYWFFAKLVGDENYEETVSMGLKVRTDETVRYNVPVYNRDDDPASGLKEMRVDTLEGDKYVFLTGGGSLPKILLSGTYVVPAGKMAFNSGIIVTGDVNLILLDDSEIVPNGGICVNPGNSLTVYVGRTDNETIQGNGKITIQDGGLLTKNRAAIGGEINNSNGPITINGGDITAIPNRNVLYRGGAGIGSGAYGDSEARILINAGKITAKGGVYAAGIGGGNEGDCKDVIINGGEINAEGWGQANDGAAGIGGGDRSSSGKGGNASNIRINGGKVTANGFAGGAGIGGGDGGEARNITISGGDVTANGGSTGPGIGSGEDASAKGINIYGGTVKAKGGSGGGAGIGAGEGGSVNGERQGDVVKVWGICIKKQGSNDIDITATGGSDGGAGIGGGEYEGGGGGAEYILIDGAKKVTATGGSGGGAGIGGGDDGTGHNICIQNHSNVNAYGGDEAAGIGGGNGGMGWAIEVLSGSDVKAYGKGKGAGIGGGKNSNGVDMKFEDCTVTAKGGDYSAGIGGGNHGDGGRITIKNATITATGGDCKHRVTSGIGCGDWYKGRTFQIWVTGCVVKASDSNPPKDVGSFTDGSDISGKFHRQQYVVITPRGK